MDSAYTETGGDDAVLDAATLAALALAAKESWDGLTLRAIADAAGLSLSAFQGRGSKRALGRHASSLFDRAMLAEPPEMADPPQERLFDALMLRYEAMEPYRNGLLSLHASRRRSPAELAAMLGERTKTAHWALVAAGLDHSEGLPLGVKRANTAWVTLRTEKAWRRETSADFSRTMAALDQALKDATERMTRIGPLFGRPRKAAAAGDAGATGPDAPAD